MDPKYGMEVVGGGQWTKESAEISGCWAQQYLALSLEGSTRSAADYRWNLILGFSTVGPAVFWSGNQKDGDMERKKVKNKKQVYSLLKSFQHPKSDPSH